VRKEECVEKVGKNLNFFAQSSDLKHVYLSELPMILLVYKEAYLTLIIWILVFLMLLKFFLQEFKDVFPEKIPSGLPPIRGIEHQIDFVPGAYRSNPKSLRNSNDKWRT